MWVHYCTNEILMRVRTSFFLLLALPYLLSLPSLNAHASSPSSFSGLSARSLDALLQDYAFRAFIRPRTGIPYDGKVPSNLTGISISALRLRSGSLKNRGVDSYKEFQIPIGVVEQPYVERLVLVYHNLGNWSDHFYPLPGYTYLAPVLGLLAYSAANLSATELPDLDIRASGQPILIKFPDLKKKQQPHSVSSPKCVYFDLNGSVQFDIPLPGNVCSTGQQGHFSIVVEESESPSPSPLPSASGGVPSEDDNGTRKKKKESYIAWIILGSVFGALALLIVLYLLVVRVRRSKETSRIKQMELKGEDSEDLYLRSVGSGKAPLALGTRTRPVIENDYVP
ncbi:hypothetical protein QN277_016074 [Acacia crassicarpa]|uniref:Uncharacterized protein n=1 Tax=Acacia crassicarpa TaxID=499986 RepID=A0AAE1TAI3_9FABA|nr:hypothetical protein QN277_016074 [Acacia crassicarpa]